VGKKPISPLNLMFCFALFCYVLNGTLTTVPCFSGKKMLNIYTYFAKLDNSALFQPNLFCPFTAFWGRKD